MRFVFFSLLTVFNASTLAVDYEPQRKVFEKAEKQLWKANSSTYQKLYHQLNDYPLQPYLDQRRLIHKMRLSSANEIARFLEKYRGTPLDWPLRKKWLTYLVKRNKKTLFLEFYKPSSRVEFTCRYFQYQLDAGMEDATILPQLTRLWTVGKSQPKVCDPLFKRWQQAGYRTPEIVWQRLVKAADGGKHTLIPYLTGLLPKKDQYLGKLWHKVRKDPSYITRLSRFPNKSAKEALIYSYGVKRLIWRDQNRALKSFEQANHVFQFNEEGKQQIALKFSLALASKNHKSAAKWLKLVNDEKLTDNLVQWRITDVLRSQNWQTIKTELLSLPKHLQSSSQWQYWHARSLIETNEKVLGQSLMTSLAKKRHYYGFLAASLLGLPIQLQDRPLTFEQSERTAIFDNLAGQRAFELFHLGRFHQARLEWNYWLSHLNKRQKLVAAKLANELGWYDRAIFALSQEGYLDDVDLRFPLAFDQQIKHHANKYAINPAWAFAITRRESSFMSDAHSSVGAKGLMQVMPGTAKQLTRRKRIPNSYLLDSSNNINLGTKYLKKLLDRHKGNQVLATAAYNAGPYRVKSWLKNHKTLPADIWIETIPFKETREYVKSVMAYQQIYQFKVGQAPTLFNELVTMNISQM